ncbi:DMT family transporter [Nitrincola tapanii]|uniref:DMT family transporter n=1 Tax=Nitrincola tapanii TaxID=1708751 RepID=A0A5A9W1G8_9GAMM|nr:DMT family transporter [Nitrincola tapanii]KAA0874324.1 DMT family transporter [Nitrincola tapanii]
MPYLILVTLLWAFSFSLIGEFLAGQVDSYFAVLTRVLLAGLLFIPFIQWRAIPGRIMLGITAVGALQFGVTYVCLYRAFEFLSVPEVLLFTIFTPLYVALIDDLLQRRLTLAPWVATALAVIGAAIIRYDQVSAEFLTGFLILQLANLAFAAGQVGYAHLMRQAPQVSAWGSFGFFYLGALIWVLPAYLILGQPDKLPSTPVQWAVLLWLGWMASGLGFFAWNKGATQVDAGTLGVMNNALIPAGLLVNLLIWNREADLLRLSLGGALILFSLAVNVYLARFPPLIEFRSSTKG